MEMEQAVIQAFESPLFLVEVVLTQEGARFRTLVVIHHKVILVTAIEHRLFFIR
jgi:hypothetical protein